jgi:hypothetical protein
MAESHSLPARPQSNGAVLDLIWGSFDSNGDPLMIPLEGGFTSTAIDNPPQSQQERASNCVASPVSPYFTNPWMAPPALSAPVSNLQYPSLVPAPKHYKSHARLEEIDVSASRSLAN